MQKKKKNELWNSCVLPSDKRVENWLLMATPIPVTMFFLAYIAIVLIGPRFMENRKPFNIKTLLFPYNVALVILSVYMFTEVRKYISFQNSLGELLDVNYYFYIAKYQYCKQLVLNTGNIKKLMPFGIYFFLSFFLFWKGVHVDKWVVF